MRRLAIVLALGAVTLCAWTHAAAQPRPLAGRWVPDDPEAQATLLTIKDMTLSWREGGRARPACVRPFALLAERPGTIYVDGRGTKFVAGAPGSIPTYLLRLEPGACGVAGDLVRISFPLIYDTAHIELIEYAGGRQAGVRRFHRSK